jgi:hypothetical protein
MKMVASTLQSVELTLARKPTDFTTGYDTVEGAMEKAKVAAEILKATAMAVATALLDQSMLTGMKSMVQLSQAAMSQNPDDSKTGAIINKFGAQQANSFVPQIWRAINDNLDSRQVEVLDVIDVFRASTFGKDDLAKQYTFLGTVRTVDNPERSFIGFLAPHAGKEVNREQFIHQTVKNLGVLTGAQFDFEPKAPGSSIGDMRKTPSTTGKGTVADRYAENLQNARIPRQTGPTLQEELYTLFTDQAKNKTLAIGQHKSPGQLVEAAKNIVNRYRTAAWKLTEEQEVANHAFKAAQERADQMKLDTANPAKDKTVPPRLNQIFTVPQNGNF